MNGTELEPWSRAFPLVGGAALFPFGKKKPPPGTPPVRHMRALAMVFGLSLILILMVTWQLRLSPSGAPAPQWPIWLWAALSTGSLGAYWGFRAARTKAIAAAATAADAVLRYRAQLMLSIAYAQVPSLVAFTVFFLTDTLVPYLVSLPVSLLLIAWASPRAADVQRLQEAISYRGGSLDLAAALMGR